jgi:hypothetical protein
MKNIQSLSEYTKLLVCRDQTVKEENKFLHKIRHYKGSIDDLQSWADEKIEATKSGKLFESSLDLFDMRRAQLGFYRMELMIAGLDRQEIEIWNRDHKNGNWNDQEYFSFLASMQEYVDDKSTSEYRSIYKKK